VTTRKPEEPKQLWLGEITGAGVSEQDLLKRIDHWIKRSKESATETFDR
jgi:hypothetical protein